MAVDDFAAQSVAAGRVVTTAFTIGGGSWARRWGRAQPIHGTTGSPELIVAEARAGVYSTDPGGLAYDPATTTWLRTYVQDDTGVVGEGELRSGWMAVPIVQPAGYTVRN